MLGRFLFASAAAIAVATAAVGQEGDDPASSTETATPSLSSSPDEAGAHEAGGAPAVAPVDELDALSEGGDDDFPEMEQAPQRKPVSVTVRALDKITARYKDLTAAIGESVKFGSLEITPRFCDKRPPEEFPETTAFLEIFDRDLSRARSTALVEVRTRDSSSGVRSKSADAVAPAAAMGSDLPAALDPDRIFAGWMFASSPALNPLEHPVYDVWVIDCKTAVVGN